MIKIELTNQIEIQREILLTSKIFELSLIEIIKLARLLPELGKSHEELLEANKKMLEELWKNRWCSPKEYY